MLGNLHHFIRINFRWVIDRWRRFRLWQEDNLAATDVGDIDPSGTLLARHRKLLADLLKGIGYCFGGGAALSGLALGAIFTGSASPIQLKIAEFVFMTASEATAYLGYAYFLFWYLNFFDVVNVFSPKSNPLSAKATFYVLLRSGFLAVIIGYAAFYILIDPATLMRDMRRRVPEFVRLLHCEIEVSEARKSPAYVATMACWDDVQASNSPVRMLPHNRDNIPVQPGD
ncbi:hypothetical protein [Ferrovibrio sp.]|uniref:hypothetical protein n=1 Tax=Ferrovibrio sp. TaxID=1917215 RepID=UPI0035B337AD